MTLWNKLFRSAGIYTASNILNASIPFFMLPVLTRYLSPEDYGVVAMFQVLTGVVAPFTGLSIHGAIARQYYEGDVDMPAYIGNCLMILASSSSVVAVLSWLFAASISGLTAFPADYLWAVLVFSVGQFILLVTLTLWQVRVKPIPYGAFLVAKTLADAALSLWFIIGLNMNWQGRVQGQVLALSAFAVLGLLVLWRGGWVKLSLRPDYLRNALKFGVPLIPHAFGMWAIQMTDRIFVTQMVGLEQTGIYLVGVQVGMIVLLLQDAFNRAWVPHLFETLKRDTVADRSRLVKVTYLYNFVLLGLALSLALVAPLLLRYFVGDAFAGAAKFVFWIALGYAFNGMYKMVANYIFFVEKTHLLAWVTFLTAAINVGATYLLILLNGAVGAAQGTALAFLVSFILTWVLSARVYRMPWAAVLGREA